jgi:hypothetical protein
MDLLNNLALGFQTALTLQNLLYAFFGTVLGTLIGVLPFTRWMRRPPSSCWPAFITALSTVARRRPS